MSSFENEGPVRVSFEGDIAQVRIDNPPVNASSQAVRAGLLKAVEVVNARGGVHAAVLSCAGRTFMAGGDISEFDGPAPEPHLPDVLAAVEASRVPFVAVLHGTVLGGGFELAMCCAYRVAVSGTRFGLPEVRLGLIPGAGGTQRLPRLIGAEQAVQLCALGKQLSAEELLDLGGLDLVVTKGALDEAVSQFVANLPERPQALSQRDLPQFPQQSYEKLEGLVRKQAKGAAAPLHNLEAVKWASEMPFSEGQPRERALHLALRDSAESRGLRHLFFAERAAAKPRILKGVSAPHIQKVAVVGGGLMGCGIAMALLAAGCDVIMVERDDAAAHSAKERLKGLLDGALSRGKMSIEAVESALQRFLATADYAQCADVDLAIEAVFEDLDVKRDVFRALDNVVRKDAILATNTSYLDPILIFEGVTWPERCIGLHFFSPAHIMKLLEIVRLPTTSDAVLAAGFALGKRLGKVSVACGICDGFIGNRMLAAYRRQADYLLADGCLPEQIDAAMRGFGLPMGPYELQDLTGLQIAWANRQRQAETRSPNERYIPFGDLLCAREHFGQRSSRGWYQYREGERAPLADPEVENMILDWGRRNSVVRHTFTTEDIVARIMAVLINEGFLIIEEGIASSAEDVDLVQVHGYGFPRWRGGPMAYAREIGLEDVSRHMEAVAAQSPNSWRIAKALAL
ncbi:FAD-dependent oxidoreductase [Polycladidibacter hongkongensis]|uniref:FAD-dependent oxidoreductase n=1 Tax=Polycladidibacter hongkongensis TaxID=1647556 RepID=UPI000831897C|nr:FAD-dependent oxidoreductase [Pseudovibrio hongkongensis]